MGIYVRHATKVLKQAKGNWARTWKEMMKIKQRVKIDFKYQHILF